MGEKTTGKIHYSRDKGVTIHNTGILPWTGDDLIDGITICVGSDYGTYDSVMWASRKGDFLYKSFDKGSTFHKDVQSGTQSWGNICKVRADGRYGIIPVESDGFYTDKPPHEDLSAEELVHPYRAVGPVTDNNLLLSDVTMSSNGRYLVAAFGNSEMGGSGLYVADDGGTDDMGRWSKVSGISLQKFEERGIVISDDGKNLVVVGWGGEEPRVAIRSDDGGASWGPIEDSVNAQFVVASADQQYIYVVKTAPDATLLISRDKGIHWYMKELNFTEEFYAFTSIARSVDGSKVYLSSYDTYGKGYMYLSHDFGVSFVEVPVTESTHHVDQGNPSSKLPLNDWGFVATNSDGMKVVAVKYESNIIFISSDAGKTWSRVATAPEAFTSICMSGDGTKIMGTGAYLYVSLDGGLSWKRDIASGLDGWLSCSLSFDGKKGAIKRVLPDDKRNLSAVYVNKPLSINTFENFYPYASLHSTTANASVTGATYESPAPSMEPTTVSQFFFAGFGSPTQAPTALFDVTRDCYTDEKHAPGKRGTGSQSNMRVYSEDECSTLKGTYTGYGECLKPSGSSFSYDCYRLPDADVSSASTSNAETPESSTNDPQQKATTDDKGELGNHTFNITSPVAEPVGPEEPHQVRPGENSTEPVQSMANGTSPVAEPVGPEEANQAGSGENSTEPVQPMANGTSPVAEPVGPEEPNQAGSGENSTESEQSTDEAVDAGTRVDSPSSIGTPAPTTYQPSYEPSSYPTSVPSSSYPTYWGTGYHNIEETAPDMQTVEPTEVPVNDVATSSEAPTEAAPSSPATEVSNLNTTDTSEDDDNTEISGGQSSWSNNSTGQISHDDDVAIKSEPATSSESDGASVANVKLCNINNIPLSTLIQGVTVPEGCVVLADKDLATVNVNPQYNHATIFLICATKDAGNVRIGSDVLAAYDMIFEGSSILSSMVLDSKSEITFYPTTDFKGGEKYYKGHWSHIGNQVYSLAKQKYHATAPPFVNVMDNVHSLIFKSETDVLSDCNSHENINRYKPRREELAVSATKHSVHDKDKEKVNAIDSQLKLLSQKTHQSINKEFLALWLEKHSHYTIEQITPQWLKNHPSFQRESDEWSKRKSRVKKEDK